MPVRGGISAEDRHAGQTAVRGGHDGPTVLQDGVQRLLRGWGTTVSRGTRHRVVGVLGRLARAHIVLGPRAAQPIGAQGHQGQPA